MALEDLTRYQGGELARRFASSDQDARYANGALYQLASDMNIEEEAKGFIDGSMASEEGIAMAVNTYAKKYKEAMDEASTDDLLVQYDEILKGYLEDEEIEKINDEFGKFKGDKYGDITKEIGKANYELEGEKKGVYEFASKDDKESAKNTIEKYKNLVTLIAVLEDIKFENLRPKSVERSQKKGLKNLVEKL